MKTLLVALNASYSHTCLAVRSIAAYCNSPDVEFVEFTINQPVGEILRGIVQKKPDAVLFSTYIWNAELTVKLIPDVKKLLPDCKIGAGGPEFGYAAKKYLDLLPELDFVVKGEGEEIIYNLQCIMYNFEKLSGENEETSCSETPCVYLRKKSLINNYTLYTIHYTLLSLSDLRFPYPELISGEYEEGFTQNRIFYYESSRGCPYSCAYCLSSVDKSVRFMPLERVFNDLQIFLDAGVKLVKFVDRTYNLQPERYIAIWKYIVEHHNKKTMFHFEIEAEYLSEEALEFLQTVPSGVMQFEMGVQSANKKTLEAVGRSANVEKLAQNVRRIPRTIHQHLDLIAGLPYEDLESFGKSFDFIMSLKPDAFQLGFLKVLSGTRMEKYAQENGWRWSKNPVYETFSTPYMSYDDMLFLKDVEVLLDAYWNNGVFAHTMAFIGRSISYWKFFYELTIFARSKNVFLAARRETFWFELLFDFLKEPGVTGWRLKPVREDSEQRSANARGDFPFLVFYNLLKYDFVLRGKQGNWPDWYEHRYDKKRHWDLLEESLGVKNPRVDFIQSEYEVFDFNVDAKEPEKMPMRYEKLLRYKGKVSKV